MFGATNSIIGIGVSIFLKDDFSKSAATFSRNFNKLSDETQAKIKSQTVAAGALGAGMALAGGLAVRGMRQAVLETAKFEDVLAKTKGIAGLTVPEVEKLKRLALDMAYRFPYGAQAISESFLELSKAGVAVKDMEKMTKAVLSFATAADIQVGGEEGATNMLLNIMAQYGMRYDQAMSVSDMITKASNLTTVDPKQIYETFRYAAPVWTQFNMNLGQSLALTSALAQAGIKSTVAGTTFANAWRFAASAVGDFSKPKQQKALASLGATAAQIRAASKDMSDPMGLLNFLQPKLANLDPITKMGVLTDIFSVRGEKIAPLFNMLKAEDVKGKPVKTLQELYAEIAKNSGGSSAQVVADRMGSSQQRIEQFNKALMDLKVSFSDAVLPIILPAIKGLSMAFRGIASFVNNTWAGKLVAIGAGFAALGAVIVGTSLVFMSTVTLARMSGLMGGLTGLKGLTTIFQALFLNMRGIFSFITLNGRLMSSVAGKGFLFRTMWWTSIAKFFSGGSGGILGGVSKLIGMMGPWGRAIMVIVGALTTLYFFSDKVKGALDSIGTGISVLFKKLGAYIEFSISMTSALLQPWRGRELMARAKDDLTDNLARAEGVKVTRNKGRVSPYNVSVTNSQGKTDEHFNKLYDLLTNKNKHVTIQVVTPSGKVLTTQQVNLDNEKALVQALGFKPGM